MSKISQKMYSVLLKGNVPADLARTVAESMEFLGESTAESTERDNYDITVIAKAMSSLVRRHKDDAPIMPKIDDVTSSDATRENSPIKPKIDIASTSASSIKRISPLARKFRNYPPKKRLTLSYFMIALSVLGIIATVAVTVFTALLSIVGMVCSTVLGIVLFIIGIVSGVSQVGYFTGAVYFEIGIGLAGAGLGAILSILLYNLLTKLLPFLFKLCLSKLTDLISDLGSLCAETRSKAKARATVNTNGNTKDKTSSYTVSKPVTSAKANANINTDSKIKPKVNAGVAVPVKSDSNVNVETTDSISSNVSDIPTDDTDINQNSPTAG